jgi:hypothetical protein
MTSCRLTRVLAASIVAGAALGLGAAAGYAVGAKGPVPQALTEAESSAEDLVDAALGGDRGSVVSTAASLKATANGSAAAALARAHVPAAKVTQLKQRANRVARLSHNARLITVALASNAVSQLMPGLYAYFRDPVPPTIGALDYLDREAQLRSLAHEPKQVARAVKQLAPTWARVRAKVIAAGGAKQAAAFQKHVAAMQRLNPAAGKKVQAEAVNGLNLVDELENVFRR